LGKLLKLSKSTISVKFSLEWLGKGDDGGDMNGLEMLTFG
jgi:hypothetical protein